MMTRCRWLLMGILAISAMLALGSGTVARAGTYTYQVDPSHPNGGCVNSEHSPDSTIADALGEDLQDGDTIFVCAGTYNEPALDIETPNISLIGPGETTGDDGTATVTLASGGPTLLNIGSPGVTVAGLTLNNSVGDAIYASAANTTIQDNVITVADDTGVDMVYVSGDTDQMIKDNHITTGQTGIFCSCDSSSMEGNHVESASQTGIIGISVGGTNLTISGNTVTRGDIAADAVTVTISNNNVIGNNGDGYLLSLADGPYTVTDNQLSDSEAPAIFLYPGYFNADATILRNTITHVSMGIELHDPAPNDTQTVTAAIGSNSATDANVFVDSGGALGDSNYLLMLDGVTANIQAKNNDWGLCSDAEIAQEVYDHADESSLGTVTYDPFVTPNTCPTPTPSPTPVSTATPTPTAAPTGSATPTPSPAPTASPTATPEGQLAWGDIDCDGILRGRDALVLIYGILGFTPAVTPPCPHIGEQVEVQIAAGPSLFWGDMDCDGTVDSDDALLVLAGIAGVPVTDVPEGCPLYGASGAVLTAR